MATLPTRTRSSSRRTSSSADPARPGILVAKRALFSEAVPTVPGGGTVAFVTVDEHAYLHEVEHREEAGTPAIVESIRAGLVFQLKSAVGIEAIREREESHVRRAIGSWERNPNIDILGSTELPRLSIVSLGLRHPRGMLHPHFVVAVLNDLFGIQARGGCFCAGPYLQRLHELDDETVKAMECEVLARPRGRQARLVSRELQLLRLACGRRLHRRRGPPDRKRGRRICCRSTASIPSPACGITARRAPRPPVSLYDISYAGAAMEFGAAALDGAGERAAPISSNRPPSFIAGLPTGSLGSPRSTIRCSRRRSRPFAGSRCRARRIRSRRDPAVASPAASRAFAMPEEVPEDAGGLEPPTRGL